jgi:hypothetical protein
MLWFLKYFRQKLENKLAILSQITDFCLGRKKVFF